MKEQIKKIIYDYFNGEVSEDLIKIEYPKDKTMGDYAIPCFGFSKVLHKNPNDIATELLENTSLNGNVLNGYFNIELNRLDYTKKIINEICDKKADFGKNNIGNGKVTINK